jgi:hypothetical protein
MIFVSTHYHREQVSDMDALTQHIEKIILQFNTRGMVPLSHKMPAGYCRRAARLINQSRHRADRHGVSGKRQL